MKTQGKPITVEDLIFEISEIHSCQILLSWDELVGSGEIDKAAKLISRVLNSPDQNSAVQSRQLLAHVMAEVGFQGFPAIKPRVIKMIGNLDSGVSHVRTGLPLLNSSELNDAPGEWQLSADAVGKIREQLLTDRQKEIIELKATEGRYTLEEAAGLIDEMDWDEADDESSGESDNREVSFSFDSSEILNELSVAALGGKLRMYWPGSDKRFTYGPRINAEVRVFFEEVYWHDLNSWLDKNKKNILARFPDPVEKRSEKKYRSIPKREILVSDWGLPPGRLKRILDEVPDWVSEACVFRGRAGVGGSSLWSPVLLADALRIEASHKKWKVPIDQLNAIFHDYFKDYREDWNDYKEGFIDTKEPRPITAVRLNERTNRCKP